METRKVKLGLQHYQSALINLALEKAKHDPTSIRFDPQGHILVEVSNHDAIIAVKTIKHITHHELEATLAAFHIDQDGTTYCNLDIRGDTNFEQSFKLWLSAGTHLDATDSNKLIEIANILIATNEASSIINLEEEMEMHMRLKAQGIIKAFRNYDIEDACWAEIQLNAAKAINEEVRKVYQKALLESYDNGTIDFVKLNKSLDNNRKKLSRDKCSNALMKACTESIDDFLPKFNSVKDTITKEDYMSSTAIHHDQMRTDVRKDQHGSENIVGTVTWIGKTSNTAHDKKLNTVLTDTQALRPIVRSAFINQNDEVIIVKENDNFPIEARVPSIAVVKGIEKAASINDVKDKLHVDHKRMIEMLGNQHDKPIIYNLLTSLPLPLTDGANRQIPSAERILKGLHIFNREQVENNRPLWFVQNIPVNQHGKILNYQSDKVTVEATLMTEIALLSTLATNYPDNDDFQQYYQKIINLYLLYIDNTNEQRAEFFNDSSEGKAAIKELIRFKNSIKTGAIALNIGTEPTLKELAAKTLLKAFGTNQHWDLQYGMLLQSLSVYSQQVSMYGCKSANERFQAVSNRVSLLRNIEHYKKLEKNYFHDAELFLNANEKNLITALSNFANGNEEKLTTVQHALNQTYNTSTLYGPSTTVSFVDQGAGSKLKSKKRRGKLKFRDIDTNIGETDLDRLHNNAGWMQAHKGDYIGDILRSAKQLRGAILRNKSPSSVSNLAIKKYYAKECQKFYDKALELVQDDSFPHDWKQSESPFGEHIYTHDNHPNITIKVNEIAKIHTIEFTKPQAEDGLHYGTRKQTVIKLLDKGAYDGNKTEDIAAPGILLIDSIKHKLLHSLNLASNKKILKQLDKIQNDFIDKINTHCCVDIEKINALRKQGYFEEINHLFAEFEAIANNEMQQIIIQVGSLLAQNGIVGDSKKIINQIKNAGSQYIEEIGRPNIIKVGYVADTKVVSAQFTRGKHTIPSTNRSRELDSPKMLSNHIIDFTGHINNDDEIKGDLTMEGHCSNPPIKEKDELKRRYFAYKSALEEIQERAQDILKASPGKSEPLIIPLSTMMLLTPFRSKHMDIRAATEHGQVADTKSAMEMLRHQKQPIEIEVNVEGATKKIKVQIDISYMNLPVNVGKNGIISAETTYNILLSKLQQDINARGMNDYFDNVTDFIKAAGKNPLAEFTNLWNKLSLAEEKIDLDNLKNQYEETLQDLYKKLEMAMLKHCTNIKAGKNGNKDVCKKIKNEILTIENKINLLERNLHLHRQEIFLENAHLFDHAIQALDAAIKTATDSKQRKELIFQKEVLLAQTIFYEDKIASPQYAYQFQMHYLRTNEYMNHCITSFCKSAEDRTGWLRVFTAAYTMFIKQEKRDPNLNDANDRARFDYLYAAKMHEASASLENTKYNSEARGLQVKEEFTCRYSNIAAGKLIAGLAKNPFKSKLLRNKLTDEIAKNTGDNKVAYSESTALDAILKEYVDIVQLKQTEAAHAFYSVAATKEMRLKEIEQIINDIKNKLAQFNNLTTAQQAQKNTCLESINLINEKYLQGQDSTDILHFSQQSQVIQATSEEALNVEIQKYVNNLLPDSRPKNAEELLPNGQLQSQNDVVSTTSSFHDGKSARINQTKITTGKNYFQDHLDLVSVQRRVGANMASYFYFNRKKAKNLGSNGCLIWAVTEIENYIVANPKSKVIAITGDLPPKVVEYMIMYAALQKAKGKATYTCINKTRCKIPKDFPTQKQLDKLDKKINDSSEQIYGVLKELGIRKKKLAALQKSTKDLQGGAQDDHKNVE